MNERMQIEPVTHAQEPALRAFLETHGRSPLDIDATGLRFWQAIAAEAIVGSIGLEQQGRAGLVRTAFVTPSQRGRGVGVALFERLASDARAAGIDRLFLFSTGAGPYWARLAFVPCSVGEAAASLDKTSQVAQYTADGSIHRELAFVRRISDSEEDAGHARETQGAAHLQSQEQ